MTHYNYKLSELNELSFTMFWKLLHCIEPLNAEKIDNELVCNLAKRTGEFDKLEEMREYATFKIQPEKLPEEVELGILNNSKMMAEKARNI